MRGQQGKRLAHAGTDAGIGIGFHVMKEIASAARIAHTAQCFSGSDAYVRIGTAQLCDQRLEDGAAGTDSYGCGLLYRRFGQCDTGLDAGGLHDAR